MGNDGGGWEGLEDRGVQNLLAYDFLSLSVATQLFSGHFIEQLLIKKMLEHSFYTRCVPRRVDESTQTSKDLPKNAHLSLFI